MTNISALLNPVFEETAPTPITPELTPLTMDSPSSPRKKAKLTKDAPVFQHGPIRGECRFPPDEFQDEELAAYHQQFEVSPFGEIADYPRHIPYNSEKKAFLEKTNREHLEVFQYTFKKPGDDTQYTVLWDYNIGLVRTTPLFKCTGHSKTTPAKMLNKNPGLKGICHSITGGALVAQGYWIPHGAAKAIAATFCYEIRHALTPVFGHDFPKMCIKPGREGYGDMTIDPAITAYCTEEARRFREEEISATPKGLAAPGGTQSPSPFPQHTRAARVKDGKVPQSRLNSPYLSPYDSDTGSDDQFTLAPSTPPTFRNPWVSVNRPKTPPRSAPRTEIKLPSPRTIMSRCENSKNIVPDVPFTPPPTITSRDCSTELSPTISSHHHLNKMSRLGDNSEFGLEREVNERLRHAIDLISSEMGIGPEEVTRRLGIFEHEYHVDQHLDAAITMESMKTGLEWDEVANRLSTNNDGHKRSASW